MLKNCSSEKKKKLLKLVKIAFLVPALGKNCASVDHAQHQA